MAFNLLLVFYFLLITCAIAITSKVLVYFLIGLEEKTKLNKSFIGIFLLALSTSLPEGIAAISSPLFSSPLLSFHNVMGANFLTITALVFLALIYSKKKILTTFNLGNFATLIILILVNIAFFFLFQNNFNLLVLNVSIWFWIYVIGYFLYVFIISKKKQEPKEKAIANKFKHSKYSAIFGFGFSASALIIFAILAVIIANQMALPVSQGGMNLGFSLGGKLFLSIATAMPEILTLFWLIKRNNFVVGYSGIVGSNILNLSFFFLTDLMMGAKSFIKIISLKPLTLYFWPIIISYILLYLLQLRTYQSERFKNFLAKSFSILIIGIYLFTLNS